MAQTPPVPQGRIRSVLVVDDHPLFSDALATALSRGFPDCAISTAATLGAAMDLLQGGLRADLVMFDLRLPDVQGISGFHQLRERIPDTPILVISSLADAPVIAALRTAGAAGFLPKEASSETLREVVARIFAGATHFPDAPAGRGPDAAPPAADGHAVDLTPQQTRIMKLICAGKANKQIAYELDLAEATVKAHITALLRRLGVQNRTQAAVLMEGQIGRNAEAPGGDAKDFLNR